MNILIAGSRHMTKYQLAKAIEMCRAVVERCKERGYSVLTGDAIGIDAIITDWCAELGVHHTCYGITSKGRIGAANYIQVLSEYRTYTLRDEYMVSLADVVCCIWNGTSSGTQHVYEYANEHGKVTRIWSIPKL